MFRRFKHSDDEPIANKLRDAGEPNVLHLDGKPVPDDAGVEWAAGGDAAAETFEELDPDEYLEDEGEGDEEDEEDDRTPEQRRADLEAELQRQAEEFGLTNMSPVTLFGPNGEAVAGVLDELSEIDDDLAEAIADAYDAIPDAERKVARGFAKRILRKVNLEEEADTAQQAVSDWLSALKIPYEDQEFYATVANAARDAVLGLVLEDELDDADFDTLYGPWSEVMDAEEEEDTPEAQAEAAAETYKAMAKAIKANVKGGAKTAKAAEAAETGEGGEEVGEFGPNTALVIEFLKRLSALETAEIGELVTVWREQPKEPLRTAHRNLQALADEDAAWREQLRLAQEEVFAWIEGRATEHHDKPIRNDSSRSREVAGPVVADSVAALAMADMLEPDDAQALYASWAEVVGEPALPEFDEEDEGEDGDAD
jgi:hypothetical protein